MTQAPAPPRPPVHYRRPPSAMPTAAAVTRRPRPRFPGNGDLAIALALVVLAVAVAAFAFTRGSRGVEMEHDDVTLPTAPPAEWSAQASWVSPPLNPKAHRVLVVGGDKVGLVTADGHVALVEAATGRTLWSHRLPDVEVTKALHATNVDRVPSVALHAGDRLLWWTLATGEEHGIDVPAGARVTFLGDGPLVVTASSAAILTQGRLSTVEVPAGATALAARSDGTVTAAAPAGWWHLAAGVQPGAAVPWESAPRRITPHVVSYSAGSILTVLPGAQPQMVVFVDRAKDVRYAFSGPVLTTSAGPSPSVTWHPAPSGTWGILSRTLVDLDQGRFEDLGAWQTTVVASDRALGRIGNQRVLAGPSIPRGVLANEEGFPEDLTASGALVRVTVPGSGLSRTPVQRVYLLPPR